MQKRKILLTFAFIAAFNCLGFCQSKILITEVKDRFYYDYGYGINFYGGFSGQLSFNWISKRNEGIVIGSELGLCLTKDLPSDYHRGGFFNIANSQSPHNMLVSYSVRYAKRLPLENSVKHKFIQLETGLSLIRYYKPTFIKDYNPYWFTSNYITSFDESTSVGLSFKASFYKPTRKFIGFINFVLTVISINICHI